MIHKSDGKSAIAADAKLYHLVLLAGSHSAGTGGDRVGILPVEQSAVSSTLEDDKSRSVLGKGFSVLGIGRRGKNAGKELSWVMVTGNQPVAVGGVSGLQGATRGSGGYVGDSDEESDAHIDGTFNVDVTVTIPTGSPCTAALGHSLVPCSQVSIAVGFDDSSRTQLDTLFDLIEDYNVQLLGRR
jgi:hypothetical protein